MNQWSLVLGLCNLNWTEGKGQMFATLLEWLCYLIAPSELILRTSIRNINSSGNNSEIQFVFINSSSNCISILPKLKCLVRNPHLKSQFSFISPSYRKLSPNFLVILLLRRIYSALKHLSFLHENGKVPFSNNFLFKEFNNLISEIFNSCCNFYLSR